MRIDDPTDPNRFVLGWHHRGPKAPLPLAVDTEKLRRPHGDDRMDIAEVFASKKNALKAIAERNAEHNTRMARLAGGSER